MFRSYTEKVYRPLVKPQTPVIEEWFTCDLCTELETELSSLWRSETDLELHRKDAHFVHLTQQMRIHTKRFCTVCMTLQKSTDELITHIKTRHLFSSPVARRVERQIFVCDYCSHVFFNKDVLEAHILYLHMWRGPLRMNKTFFCPKCKKIVQLKTMWYHLQQHEIPSVSVCDICLTACRTTHDLREHLKTHPMYYMCDICNYQTPKEDLYHKHLDMHKENQCEDMNVSKYTKQVFIRAIPSNFHLKYNIQHTVRGLRVPNVLHICVLCREICKDNEEMCAHLRRDHMRPLRPYRAPQFRCSCGDSFASRVLLRHHAFKLQGAHRALTDDAETSEHRAVVQEETEARSSVQSELAGNNETGLEIEAEWQQVETEEEEEEVAETGPIKISESVTLTCVGAPPAAGDELVYIYAAVNDEEAVTIEQDATP